jgi:hypothetical protein
MVLEILPIGPMPTTPLTWEMEKTWDADWAAFRISRAMAEDSDLYLLVSLTLHVWGCSQSGRCNAAGKEN